MKNCHWEQFINPIKCIKAVRKFCDLGNPHFQGIEINENFMNDNQEDKDDEEMDTSMPESDRSVQNDETNDETEDEEDDGNMLNSVRAHQCDRSEITCLVHDNLDEDLVENLTKKTVSKKKSIKSTKSFEIAPGEGKIPNNWLRDEHFDTKGFLQLYPTGKYGLNHPREPKLSAQQFFCQRLVMDDDRFAKNLLGNNSLPQILLLEQVA